MLITDEIRSKKTMDFPAPLSAEQSEAVCTGKAQTEKGCG